MHTRPIQHLAFALLLFVTVAGTAVAAAAAWIFGLTAWIACVALLLSAILVAGGMKLYEAWREARWDAGRPLR